MVPIPLTYQDDWRLPEWGYGLTNIVDRPTSGIHGLTVYDYAKGRQRLFMKVRRYRPKIMAVLGITVRKALFPKTPKPSYGAPTLNHPCRVGLQQEKFGGAMVFMLPNPSGRNTHDSFRAMLRLFRQLHHLNKNV